jgi:hypothetical protein
MVATILGLVGFTLLPVAPPRMLPGFVDTMAKYAEWGWWSGDASAPRGVGQWTNEFAAMPSLHVGWALWCGWQLIHHGRTATTKILGSVYPAITTFVVVGTANHYVLDAVAGMLVIAVAGLCVTAGWWLTRPRVVDLRDVPAQRGQPAAADTAETTDGESVVMPDTPIPRR